MRNLIETLRYEKLDDKLQKISFNDEKPMYLKLELKRILNLNSIPCDLFLKLSDKKYVKILHANDVYDEDFVLSHMLKGVKFFYYSEEEKEVVHKFLARSIEFSLKVEANENKFDLMKMAFDGVTKFALELGMNEVTSDLVKQIQESAIKDIRKNKDIYQYLGRKLSHNDYLAEHSLLVSTISCAVASKMSWSNKATLKKFVNAALFHDIAFTNHELSRIAVTAELETGNYSREEKQEVLSHPEESCDVFLSLEISCPNCDSIILLHHELPDGSGFPRGLDANNTPPYVCLFILAEAMADIFYNKGFNDESWSLIRERFDSFYNRGNYRKPIEGFRLTFKELSN